MTLSVRPVALAQPISKAAGLVAAVLVLALTAGAQAHAQAESSRYAGRSVADVLQDLQTAELRIIFSSDLVPPMLRVMAEPKSSDPRQLVLEILEPHGLTLRKGPGRTQLVVALPATVPPKPHHRKAPPDAQRIQAPTEATRAIDEIRVEEQVEVTDRLVDERGRSGGYALEPSAIRETAGGFENVFRSFRRDGDRLIVGAAAGA